MRLKYRRHYKTHFDSCLNDLYNMNRREENFS